MVLMLMMLMLSRVNKVCVLLLFLRVSFVRDFWGPSFRRRNFFIKIVGCKGKRIHIPVYF